MRLGLAKQTAALRDTTVSGAQQGCAADAHLRKVWLGMTHPHVSGDHAAGQHQPSSAVK